MNNDQKVLAGVAAGVALVIGAAVFISRPVTNVSVEGPAQPVVVSGDATHGGSMDTLAGLLQALSTQIESLAGQFSAPQDVPNEFGGTTNWNSSIHTRADLRVDGDSTLNDDITVLGDVNATSVERLVTKSFTSSASSQTLATFSAPTTGRFITGLNCQVATSTFTGGTYRLTASLGTTAATGTTMGTDLLLDITNTVPITSPFWTPTSTLMGFASTTGGIVPGSAPFNTTIVGGPLYQSPSQIVTVSIASPTSTLAGACYLEYASLAQNGA